MQSQKLIAQYRRLHAEKQTVKAAYLMEKQKVQSMESVVKEKEVVLRSSVEENDMLTFKNQRLTKRVEQLMLQLSDEKAKATRCHVQPAPALWIVVVSRHSAS